ncbi:hypothetical protein [Candidatus Berkiella aquae]|uniref:Uncharacterized protein n=1 Tax=Candidatus Berkiella aquae TaxID=295108 RepID=A0A0Q9YYC3_9GAMM|nr:hypothetical protein [Candidatus Berkiella aquae]MCS5710556.1 hypothetical protein [Candidatus Berkiella aquae]
MKRLTWILLATTIPTVVIATTAAVTTENANSNLAQEQAAQATTATSENAKPSDATTPATSVNAAGLPLSGSDTTTISADPAATVAPTPTVSNAAGQPVSGSETTAISADPAATTSVAAPEKVGPRPGGPNKGMLPEEFKVYYSEKTGFSKTALKGSTEKIIPTKNDFTEVPGCYISCYSKDKDKGVYHVGDNTYLIGQIRVSGHYYGGNCLPKGFESKDIRNAKEFKEMCEKDFPDKCEKESCTVGSNSSAQWFN